MDEGAAAARQASEDRCPADGSPLRRWLRGEQAGCTFAICDRCGLVWTLPLLSESELPALYEDRLSSNFQPSDARLVAAVKDAIAGLQLRWMQRMLGRVPTSTLDYGTGNGRYAVAAARRGWPRVMACDWHREPPAALRVPQERERGREAAGSAEDAITPARYVPIAEVAVLGVRFDFVLLRAVLEHTSDPHRMLASVHDLLQPGGAVYIEVPNVESWSVRSFGRYAQSLFVPFHRVHFRASTLDATVRQAGLVPIAAGGKTMPKIADQIQHALPVVPRLVAQLLGAAGEPFQLVAEHLLGRENLWMVARRPE